MKIINKKKLNNQGFSHIEFILIILVIIAIVSAGFFVYTKNKNKNLVHAGGYLYTQEGVDTINGKTVTFDACKTFVNLYGGVWQDNVLITKASSTPAYRYYVQWEPVSGKPIHMITRSTAYYAGVVAGAQVNLPYLSGLDFVQAGLSGYGYFAWLPNAPPNCT